MSTGPNPPPPIKNQSQYDAFMVGVSGINDAGSFTIGNVDRDLSGELSDCEKVALAIQALQNFYSQNCPII